MRVVTAWSVAWVAAYSTAIIISYIYRAEYRAGDLLDILRQGILLFSLVGTISASIGVGIGLLLDIRVANDRLTRRSFEALSALISCVSTVIIMRVILTIATSG
jgi:hypothetical protein